MSKFALTTEGYIQAKRWLMEIGKWEEVSTRGFSTDGYTIVHTANLLWTKLMT
jgi:hypothetical protein